MRWFWTWMLSVACFAQQAFVVSAACQQCLVPALHRHHRRHHLQSAKWLVAANGKSFQLATTVSGIAAWKHLPHRAILKRSAAGALVGAVAIRMLKEVMDDEEEREKDAVDKGGETKEEEKPPLTSAMVATIGVYKNFISPLLPPACRFLPTCSQYGVQAIEEFGPTKGSILTAWRLLRCSPFGGKGYDPPRWPPVPYTYSSY
mmetsp:Transcript_56265/g.163145  ORF Transcript_56265/g.163145 Transcript_56265/m.163145 type:complete len:203 (-) Transcript_56265:305-913(-)|eukprot:CAMPEP_0176005986 /NCGR_PEP_ID=MMETSP0120_2-20121206/2489_1 /TAXON_ID=160619 /ORGANISM="Kryptoperidinium foliaceum, Strain CCMP 1326" /LENGTH=202 /DNA_ID=CAMNT_0017338711 /DNA_START=124 /DNA_END=732 /DNA_ORIENTATION=-